MAGAAYIGRSPGSDTGCGGDQLAAFLRNTETIAFSAFNVPSTHASTIVSVAPSPVGAPLAMSTLGAAERSVRAPL